MQENTPVLSGYGSLPIRTQDTNHKYRQQKTLVEVLGQCNHRKDSAIGRPCETIMPSPLPTLDLGCGAGPTQDSISAQTQEDAITIPSLMESIPLVSEAEQCALEHQAIQDLPLWEQELEQLQIKADQLSDQIEVARIYIAVRKATQPAGSDPNAFPALKDPDNDHDSPSDHWHDDITSYPSDSTLVENGRFGYIQPATRPSSQGSLAGSDLEMAMTGSPLGTTLFKESMFPEASSFPPVATSALGKNVSQWSNQPDTGLRPKKRRRLLGQSPYEVQRDILNTSPNYKHCSLNNIMDSAAFLAQQWNLPTRPQRNRVCRILLGQLAALQRETQKVGLSSSTSHQVAQQGTEPCTERPVSYPQSQRWRKSLGISVRTLREGFGNLKI